MSIESSKEIRGKIQVLGWGHENDKAIVENLNRFETESSDHLLEISLEEYSKLQNKKITDYVTKDIQGYCSYYMTARVRRQLCLLVLDSQRDNMNFDAVVNLKYQVDSNSVTLTGLAVKLK